MPFFDETQNLYATIGGFFETLTTAEEGQLIHRVGGSVLFIYHRPEGRILWTPCDPPGSWPAFRVSYGTACDAETPLLTFEQDGDTAHRFWLGEIDLAQALARQQLRAIGPLSRAMKLLPHLDTVYPRYAAFVAEGVGRRGDSASDQTLGQGEGVDRRGHGAGDQILGTRGTGA